MFWEMFWQKYLMVSSWNWIEWIVRLLNLSSWNPLQTFYWHIVRTEITSSQTFAFTNAWCESCSALMSSINLFTVPVCPYHSLALKVMTYACLLMIQVCVCVSMFFPFLFSTSIIFKLEVPQVKTSVVVVLVSFIFMYCILSFYSNAFSFNSFNLRDNS